MWADWALKADWVLWFNLLLACVSVAIIIQVLKDELACFDFSLSARLFRDLCCFVHEGAVSHMPCRPRCSRVGAGPRPTLGKPSLRSASLFEAMGCLWKGWATVMTKLGTEDHLLAALTASLGHRILTHLFSYALGASPIIELPARLSRTPIL